MRSGDPRTRAIEKRSVAIAANRQSRLYELPQVVDTPVDLDDTRHFPSHVQWSALVYVHRA